jgi:hypothetical protein
MAFEIALALTAVASVVIGLSSWRNRFDMAQLGTVSQRWLAEQRANDRHYSER